MLEEVHEVEVELANGNTATSGHKRKVSVDIRKTTLTQITIYFFPKVQISLLSRFSLGKYGITTGISERVCILIEREQETAVLKTFLEERPRDYILWLQFLQIKASVQNSIPSEVKKILPSRMQRQLYVIFGT